MFFLEDPSGIHVIFDSVWKYPSKWFNKERNYYISLQSNRNRLTLQNVFTNSVGPIDAFLRPTRQEVIFLGLFNWSFFFKSLTRITKSFCTLFIRDQIYSQSRLLKLCHIILSSLPAKNVLITSVLISLWDRENILTSDFRWLAQKKRYGNLCRCEHHLLIWLSDVIVSDQSYFSDDDDFWGEDSKLRLFIISSFKMHSAKALFGKQ